MVLHLLSPPLLPFLFPLGTSIFSIQKYHNPSLPSLPLSPLLSVSLSLFRGYNFSYFTSTFLQSSEEDELLIDTEIYICVKRKLKATFLVQTFLLLVPQIMKTIDSSLDADLKPENGRKIIMHPLYTQRSSPWLDLRIFYIRISNCELNSSTPDQLTLNHIPLSPDTIIEVNGTRSSIYTEWISSSLRRDRVDKNSEEATFVTTDCMRMTGSVRFQVFDKDDLLLTGDLELNNDHGNGTGNGMKKWAIKCQSTVACNGFLKGQEGLHPVIELYVAGSFSGTPIILTNTIHLGLRKKTHRKIMLQTIPEYEMVEEEHKFRHDTLKVSEYEEHKQDSYTDTENNNIYYAREDSEFLEGEDEEISWFNAGVRVGVGIGLGVCVGIGIGVGLMVSTYQSTTRNFRRRLL